MICFPMWVYRDEGHEIIKALVHSQEEFDAKMADGFGLFEHVVAKQEIKDEKGGQGGPIAPPKKHRAKKEHKA